MSSSPPAALPFLPGYRVEVAPKDRYHKTHIFDVSNGIRVDMNKEKFDSRGAGTLSTAGNPLPISSPKKVEESKQQPQFTPSSTMSRLPSWVAYDRKVLRFSGYFRESIHASNIETWRVRKCLVYFYLEDDSMHIAEPKVENSGIPQGVFVKRHRIPKEGAAAVASNGGYYSVDDLYIGAELSIYGRVFRLTDSDTFTREFYKANGVELGQSEDIPLDSFTSKKLSSTQAASVPTSSPHSGVVGHHKMMNPLKTFMEASLGKPMHAGIEATQKFLQNDGRVLRFYAQWDDDKMYGEIRPYIVHYFLADDTVEVQEVSIPNSGRDPFPSLLKRQKLPKNFHEIGMDLSRIGSQSSSAYDDPSAPAANKVVYYSPTDFRVGGWIQVYGRNLFLCGVDEFTKEYYQRYYGLSEEDFPRLNMSEPSVPLSKIEPPEHNGFGSEEDSLASFLYLMPKVPKADFKKLIELDGINLRFLAKFKSTSSATGKTNKVDQNRKFIVTYYLANDTFQVFEKFERNSGFVGGKFLERDRVKNPLNGEWYRPSDFYVGSIIQVNKFEFEIIDTDMYTQKFMQNNQQVWGENAQKCSAKSVVGTGKAFQGESTQDIRATDGTNERELEQQFSKLSATGSSSSRPVSQAGKQIMGF